MKDIKRRRLNNWFVAFLILFVGSLTIHLLVNNTECHYDADTYWRLGKTCGFDVRNLDWGFRGWLLPYLFSLCYQFGMVFGSEFLGYRIFSSVIFALFFSTLYTYLIKMFEYNLSQKKSLIIGAIGGGLFFLYFRGLLIYTLSDFYAMTLSVLAVVMLYQIVTCNHSIRVKILEAFIVGLCLYGAYNIRTIYLFLMIAAILVLIIWHLYEKKWLQLIITLPISLLGILICSIPQIIMNHHLLKTYSMAVPTDGLMLYQLQWGVYSGRYATYIGDKSQYGAAGMFFLDKIGQTVLEKEQITEFVSYGDFFRLILKYPLDFVGIYVRHFLNMLYPFYPNQYIESIENDKSLLLWLFYTILFIAIFYFVYTFKAKIRRWIWMLLILVPCVCIMPGAVEIRFFITLHLLIYMYSLLGIKDFIIKFRENKWKYITLYVVGFLLYIAYAGSLLASTKDGIAIING